jgi:hypothetical protein
MLTLINPRELAEPFDHAGWVFGPSLMGSGRRLTPFMAG